MQSQHILVQIYCNLRILLSSSKDVRHLILTKCNCDLVIARTSGFREFQGLFYKQEGVLSFISIFTFPERIFFFFLKVSIIVIPWSHIGNRNRTPQNFCCGNLRLSSTEENNLWWTKAGKKSINAAVTKFIIVASGSIKQIV